ncbi:MAG TPA: hypothetical protein VFE47_24990 [Tepidisphaeraceae bacterium]|jgi:hypothetical protein|nr:hypothetical protein [Tepidisphaeraceae bacterium]
MTLLHPFHVHSHRFHYFFLRYMLPLLLALVLFFLLASPARGQVMIDASQLHGQLPGWVDPAYARPPVTEPPQVIVIEPRPLERIWIPAVTQRIVEKVWVADRYEDRLVLHCDGGRTYWVHEFVLVQPAHWETRCREIVIVPGHWEIAGPGSGL